MSNMPPIWVWQTCTAMLLTSLLVYLLTGDPGWAVVSQLPVVAVVGHLSSSRYDRRQGWRS